MKVPVIFLKKMHGAQVKNFFINFPEYPVRGIVLDTRAMNLLEINVFDKKFSNDARI